MLCYLLKMSSVIGSLLILTGMAALGRVVLARLVDQGSDALAGYRRAVGRDLVVARVVVTGWMRAFVASSGARSTGRWVYSAIPVLMWVSVLSVSLSAGADGPWEEAVEALCDSFTGILGTGLSLVAIAIGGLMFAFGEGGSKSQIAGLIFGAGLVLQAPNFLIWLGVIAAGDCGTAATI